MKKRHEAQVQTHAGPHSLRCKLRNNRAPTHHQFLSSSLHGNWDFRDGINLPALSEQVPYYAEAAGPGTV